MLENRDSPGASTQDASAALRRLALSYAREADRDRLESLLLLDASLGNILRTTREPIVGRMRLAWWREALERLDSAPAPAEPTLRALEAHVVGRHDVTGVRLAVMVEGWEWLLEAPLDPHALRRHAALRSELFTLMANMCGVEPGRWVARAGRGWALADLSAHLSEAGLAATARRGAERLLDSPRPPWPRALRPVGALALIARADLKGTGGIGTVSRLGWLRLTGR